VGELVSRRVLERTDEGAYRVGLPLRMIGGLAFPFSPPLLERALDVINDVTAVTGASVRVGVLDTQQPAVRATEPGRSAADGFTEDPTPVYASALGRVLLAFSPASVVDEVVAAGPLPFSPDRLRRLLATTRLARVAVYRDARGRCQMAVPVFGTGGTLLGALEASVLDPRSGLDQIRGALLVAAGSLSRQLATTSPPDEPGIDATDATA
jgi:IclR family transcriptional regulator, acetate operon repressor